MKSIIRRLIDWTKKEIRSKIPFMADDALFRSFADIPPPQWTRQGIIAWLNSKGEGIWEEVPGYYALGAPYMDLKNINFQIPVGGIVLKAFYNRNTTEIRTFVAKYLDIPDAERRLLWK